MEHDGFTVASSVTSLRYRSTHSTLADVTYSWVLEVEVVSQ
jgi:hypothetical protein